MVYPSSVTYQELVRFTQLLGKKGKSSIAWDIWKHSYRKAKFESIVSAMQFVGFVDSANNLTTLGKHFVFGKDKNAIVIGLIQSDYFDLFRELLKEAKPEEEVFNMLSRNCELPLPEKERRSMYRAFKDLTTNVGLIKVEDGKTSLEKVATKEIERHSKTPLWVYDLPLFTECKRIERFKALYYETGNPFRDIVRDAFSELGFKANNLPDKTQGIPDIEVVGDSFHGVVEAKGETKQIGENDVSQLSKSQTHPDFKDKKLILVGNAFRLKLPSQRGAFFHDKAITLATSKGILLLSSLVLLRSLEAKWKIEKIDLQTVTKKLTQNGLCSAL